MLEEALSKSCTMKDELCRVNTGFIKVYCCTSEDELEALEHVHEHEDIPLLLLDLDHIKAKAEKDLGSSKDLEYLSLSTWEPLTSIHALVSYQRLNSFQYMHVIPLRVPSLYEKRNPISNNTGVQELESVVYGMTDVASKDHVEAKLEDDHKDLEDNESLLCQEWEIL
jgi:hypothetical protein